MLSGVDPPSDKGKRTWQSVVTTDLPYNIHLGPMKNHAHLLFRYCRKRVVSGVSTKDATVDILIFLGLLFPAAFY